MPNYLSVFTNPEGETAVKGAYQAILDCWPVSYSEQTIPTRFGELHVIASGPVDAPPVILLHAYFATAAVWYPNVGALSSNYRVYAVDFPGEANLSRPTRPISSLEEFAECFCQLFDALGIRQAALVGNSFGGFLAATLAMQLPQRVRGIVMLGPAATFRPIFPFMTHIFLPKAANLFFPKIPGHPGRMRRSMDWMYAGLQPDILWDELFYQVMLHGTVINRISPRVVRPEEWEQIKSLPALLLIGDHEKIYRPEPEAVLRAAKQAFPGIETEIIPHAHHITALSNPEAVNRRILAFLGKL